MGVRQLGHPVQGLRHPGHPPRPLREDRGCRAGARATRRSRRRWPCTSRGTRSTTTTTLAQARRGPRRRARHDQLEHLPGRRLQVRRASPTRTPAVRQKAIDHHFECIDIMHATGSPRPEDLARRRHELPGPGRPARPPGPPARVAREDLRRASATSSASCSSTSSSSRRSTTPTFPTGARATRRCAALGDKAMVCLDTGHHAPGHEHRVHRHAAAAPRQARLVRLQLALLRRRRPHRGRRRPVPAVPHHLRGDPRRRLQPPRRRVHARPVPQRRGQDPRPDPLACSTCRR